jgi:hypothetical protein
VFGESVQTLVSRQSICTDYESKAVARRQAFSVFTTRPISSTTRRGRSTDMLAQVDPYAGMSGRGHRDRGCLSANPTDWVVAAGTIR